MQVMSARLAGLYLLTPRTAPDLALLLAALSRHGLLPAFRQVDIISLTHK